MSNNGYYPEEIKQTFLIESKEMLEEMEQCLLLLEKNPADEDTMNALFRTVHTIKGTAGMFSYYIIEEFTHICENILDRLRKHDIPMDSGLSALLIKCHDFLNDLFEYYQNDPDKELSSDVKMIKDSLTEQLNTYLKINKVTGENNENKKGYEKNNKDNEHRDTGNKMDEECWQISIQLKENVFHNGLDPYSFINYLNEIGEIIDIKTITDRMPVIDVMNPEKCYLGFVIKFRGNVTKEIIEDVFEFIKDDSEIQILPPESYVEKYVDMIEELPEESKQIGEMLLSVGSLTGKELEEALLEQKEKAESEGDVKQLGEILFEKKMVRKPVLEAAINKQKEIKKSDKLNAGFLRINTEKIDHLINLVGELVITGSNVKQLSDKIGESGLLDSVSVMTRLVEEIRDSTMNIRMVPIGDTFKKFERTVRDLSRENGKEIDLVISGGDTELDKSLIDRMSDPLMHLIRNSIDHGIGMPDEREKKGKPRRGTITLNAYHEMSGIVIIVADDGNGLDKKSIYKKAIDSGYIQNGENIQDNDLFQFIFEPGFSTAKKVTNISGRGVGMDVVKRNIETLQGTLAIESEENTGTIIRIHLPLTLAIIDGFMVQVANNYYVIPQDMLVECTDVSSEVLSKEGGGNFINLRGELLPYMRLREFFNKEKDIPGKEIIVVVEYAKKIVGLVVDRPVGEVQTVIKPLGKYFLNSKWISGATILGSGEVALIIDVPKLIQIIENTSKDSEKAIA